MDDDPFVFGQDVERRIGMTGWVAPGPDGTETAFLLVSPAGDDAAHRMRDLAAALGLANVRDGPMPAVPLEEHWAILDDERVLWLRAREVAWTNLLVDADWAATARARGSMVLAVGLDPYTPRHDRLAGIARYLARGHRVYAGLLRLR